MARHKNTIEVCYSEELKDLENLLSTVKYPGDFYVKGSKEVTLPKIEVDGVGVLSFPIPKKQIKSLIKHAERAPYGRGEATILDVSVRKVWQIPPQKVRVKGSSWKNDFNDVIAHVRDGLGCQEASISAELYKLLIYDEGSFFKAHRDTEKTDNMFGTLILVLPSAHRGGELLIRHAKREVTVNLNNSEVSQLTYAAFYSDCEHEVLPILEDNRVCLVYNLVQLKRTRKFKQSALVAPLYDHEIAKAAAILDSRLSDENEDAPDKIAWILEHQYSPAALSFSTLKNGDIALARVLCEASSKANLDIYLAIVHLEETGGAAHRSYHDSDDDDYGAESEEDQDDFEIIEVCNSDQYVDSWVSPDGQLVTFGRLPLQPGELLPDGALDGEPPDKMRFTEASGNEGASFNRAYHRAAFVIWRQDCYPKVLLKGGICPIMPYLKECLKKDMVNDCQASGKTVDLMNVVLGRWEEILEEERNRYFYSYRDRLEKADRSAMLSFLSEIGQMAIIERFISNVLISKYDGTENAALVLAVRFLDPDMAANIVSSLISANMNSKSEQCVELSSLLVKEFGTFQEWKRFLKSILAAVVTGLKEVGKNSWSTTILDASTIVTLWNLLLELQDEKLQDTTAGEITSRPTAFDPRKLLVPALCQLFQTHQKVMHRNTSFLLVWQHTGKFLLGAIGQKPTPPQDWKQNATISCDCEDCVLLQKFVFDPQLQTRRFCIERYRRQHLEMIAQNDKLSMTRRTQSRGSSVTLVLTKTLRSYELASQQFKDDIAAMKLLIGLVPETLESTSELRAKLLTRINA